MSAEIDPCRPKEGADAARAWHPQGVLPPPAPVDQAWLPSAYRRARRALIAKMRRKQKMAFSCVGCDGRCCTSLYNRMRITPLEARHIARYLSRIFGRDPSAREEILARLHESIRRFSLKRSEKPQAYTCPFFRTRGHLCMLPASVKPVGCLAFNPDRTARCDLDPLLFLPANQTAKGAAHGPAWPIPVAVLDALDSLDAS